MLASSLAPTILTPAGGDSIQDERSEFSELRSSLSLFPLEVLDNRFGPSA